MKKAFTATLLAILTCACTVFGLAACADEACAHTYDNACDAICNACGETREITHTWAAADCVTPKTCSVCGATDGNALGHSETAYSYDDHYHYDQCSVCEAVNGATREKHTLDDAYACDCGIKFTAEVSDNGDTVELYNSKDQLVKTLIYEDDNISYYIDDYRNENGDLMRKEYYNGDGSGDGYNLYEYDENGDLIKENYYNDDGSCVGYSLYENDENGNKIKETYADSDGDVSVIEYDENGNKIKETYVDPDGDVSVEEYDENGNRIKETYTYSNGDVIVGEYDENGNEIKQTYTYSDGGGYVGNFEYDENGNVIKQTYTYSNGDVEVYEYEYDENGNKIKQTLTYSNGDVSVEEYDENGNLTKETYTYSDGRVTVTEYD